MARTVLSVIRRKGFSNAISWLLTDTQLADRMGARAKQMTTQQYNVHASTSQLERIFNDTINSGHHAKKHHEWI